MLKALYDYAVLHDLSLPDGYVRKSVAAYITFSSLAPEHVGIHLGDDREIACPDIGSLANGKEKSNILVEKRSVVLPTEESPKNHFFLSALAEFGTFEPDAALCVRQLARPELRQKIDQILDENKIKPASRISFQVDGRRLHDSPHLLEWWRNWRKKLLPPQSGDLVPCLITGEPVAPLATTPSIKGLRVVGGHSSGDALICFDKPAFCSYGQKQAANAPVSETAMGAVKAALDHLLEDAPPPLCGMKFVHWYDREVPQNDDPIFDRNLFGFQDEDDDEDENESPSSDEAARENDLQARRAADRMLEAVQSGKTPAPLDTGYHILLLSGVNGRVMVRRYERGRYAQLQKNITQWNSDLELIRPDSRGTLGPMKLTGRLIRLLKYQKDDRRIFERLDKELSGITPAILTSILSGGQLPDAVAVRALAYIRSRLLSSDDEQSSRNESLDGRACQWLKVWLLRNHERSENQLSKEYNPTHPEAAYHCGAAMAVYAAIQNRAMQDVNVSVVQRYYASCIQTPALVLGRLSQLSVHHLAKLEKPLRFTFTKKLEAVYSAIGAQIPTTLELEKQAYFALGYYQMSAELNNNRGNSAENNAQEEA